MKNYQYDSIIFRLEEDEEEISERDFKRITDKGLQGWRVAGVVQFPTGWVEILLEKEGHYGETE